MSQPQCPPPHPSELRSDSLPIEGRDGVCCTAQASVVTLGHASSPRRVVPREGISKNRPPILRNGPSALFRMKGMARRKAQTYGVRSFGKSGGRLSARHMRSSRPEAGSACYLRHLFGAGPRFRFYRRPLERAAVVSQLLAGSRSGPGRSPGAARVPGLRTGPAGAAPRPAVTTPHDRAPQVDEVMQCKPGLERGDKQPQIPSFRRKPKSRRQAPSGDTRLRRYDKVWFLPSTLRSRSGRGSGLCPPTATWPTPILVVPLLPARQALWYWPSRENNASNSTGESNENESRRGSSGNGLCRARADL
jgi:hypothetical protein